MLRPFCQAVLFSHAKNNNTAVFVHLSFKTQVVPIAPCRGVEDWKEKKCGGEDIWDHAWGFAGGPDFGLAVNPVQRRSQHQLHIHIAKLQQGLLPALRDIAKNKDTSWTPIVCNPKVATKCKVDKKQQPLVCKQSSLPPILPLLQSLFKLHMATAPTKTTT